MPLFEPAPASLDEASVIATNYQGSSGLSAAAHEWAGKVPQVLVRLRDEHLLSVVLEDRRESDWARAQEARQDAALAASNLKLRPEAYASRGLEIPESELAQLERESEEAKSTENLLRERSKQRTAAANATRGNVQRLLAYCEQAAVSGAKLKQVSASPPSSDWAQVQSDCERRRAELDKEERLVKGAAPPEAEYLKRTLDRLRQTLANPLPRLSHDLIRGASLAFPMRAVAAEPSGDDMPAVPDLTPLVLSLIDPEQLEEHIAGQVAAFYRDKVPLALSEAERNKRLDRIAADRLQNDRVEAAAVWAAREAGVEMAFGKDIDPRAVLGIDGPPPRKRRERGRLD